MKTQALLIVSHRPAVQRESLLNNETGHSSQLLVFCLRNLLNTAREPALSPLGADELMGKHLNSGQPQLAHQGKVAQCPPPQPSLETGVHEGPE